MIVEGEGREGERRREKYKASSDNNRDANGQAGLDQQKRQRNRRTGLDNCEGQVLVDGWIFLFCWFNEEPRSHGSLLEAVVLLLTFVSPSPT